MIAAATNLLSPEEGLATLDSTVFPLEARPDLICDGPDGRLLISKKGRQFYTAAFRRGGIVVDFASIRAAFRCSGGKWLGRIWTGVFRNLWRQRSGWRFVPRLARMWSR